MEKALITIRKGQFSCPQIRSLEQIVLQNYRTFISKEELKIMWNLIPHGNTYKDNEVHQPSFIHLACDTGFCQERRTRMFKKLSKDWLDITGQNSEDLTIAILEKPAFEDFISRTRKELTQFGRLKLYSNVMLNMTYNKTFKGYYAFDASF